MAPILKLIKSSNHDTVELLEALTELARHEEVDDVVICYRKRGSPPRIARTGSYGTSAAEALRAIMKVSVYLTEIEDQVRKGP